MHDHYITLAAVLFGKVIFLEEATVKYRQHGRNVLGSGSSTPGNILKRYRFNFKSAREKIFSYADQAKDLSERFGDQLPEETLELLRDFARIRELGFFQRKALFFRRRLWKNGFFRNFGMLLIA